MGWIYTDFVLGEVNLYAILDAMTPTNDVPAFEKAIQSYQRGEVDRQAAARYAGISVHHLMVELEKRDITPPAATEKFVTGLKTLVETFGGSQALRETIAEYEAQLSASQPD